MNYIRRVDFDAYPADTFCPQWLYNGDSCIIVHTHVPPGVGPLPRHFHEHSDQLYYVTQGAVHITLADEEVVAGTDSLIYIPRGTPHQVRDARATRQMFLEVAAPPPLPVQSLLTLTESTDAGGRAYFVRAPGSTNSVDLDGTRTQALLERADGAEQMGLYLVALNPGAGDADVHLHDFDQFFFVLSGELSLQIGLQKVPVCPYELVIVPCGVPHRLWNETRDAARHLTVVVPAPLPDEEWKTDVALAAKESGRQRTSPHTPEERT